MQSTVTALNPRKIAEFCKCRFTTSFTEGDQNFAAPIYADLFDDEDGEGSTLISSHPITRRGD